MFGWVLFWFFLLWSLVSEGLLATIGGLTGALGIDMIVATITGASLGSIFSGAGLADDVVMLLFGCDLSMLEKIALGVWIEESSHVLHEADEYYSHTDEQNEQYARYLAVHEPGPTYLFGDVTPRDLISLGLSSGVLGNYGTLGTILDVAKSKFGGLVDLTADAVEVGGAL